MGLEIAWEKRWQNITFEMDSKMAMEMVCSNRGELHTCRPIIVTIQEMLKMSWQVEVTHCYREANQVTNFHVNAAHDNGLLKGVLDISMV